MTLMDTPITRHSPPSHRRKIFLGTVIVFGCLAVAAVLVVANLEADPRISIPTPVLPSPNAYDDYARATALIKDPDKIDDWAKQNAGKTTLTPTEAQQQILRDNALALAAFQEGLAHSYLTPPIRSFKTEYSGLALDRRFARLLLLDARMQAAQGDWGASARISLDGLKLGSDLPRGAPMLPLLVGIAVNAISRRPLRTAIGHLSLPETRAALARLQAIDANSTPLAQTFREEKWTGQAGLMETYRQKNWRTQFFTLAGGGDEGEQKPPLAARMSAYLTSKRRIMDDYTYYMDSIVADVDARRPIGPLSPAHSDLYLEILAPVFSSVDIKYNQDRTQNAFLEVELALRAYQLQHHAYPESLAALTPTLIPNVPADPFAPTHSLNYRKEGASYRLYSVGPDGVDDGGKAIEDPTRSDEHFRHIVQADSKGDIVAGVNL
ncbi:hypothetical protein CCAX7_18580 [Capsulimonas corticalis]|uniref:Uncharacterized protein n=1 Tax=Capsulimonas corticalis TaxID=2219043 RepID=A0A402D5M7_9BACT|nr:hypothetical protein [Capsulimonas corticalis]BDI29807.1 hypothetical protein CCAX7_18580 [Capsulimonas corticalis]